MAKKRLSTCLMLIGTLAIGTFFHGCNQRAENAATHTAADAPTGDAAVVAEQFEAMPEEVEEVGALEDFEVHAPRGGNRSEEVAPVDFATDDALAANVIRADQGATAPAERPLTDSKVAKSITLGKRKKNLESQSVRSETPRPTPPAPETPDAITPTTPEGQGPGNSGDKFDHLVENEFLTVADHALSTFSVDVDTASYSKTRMFILQNRSLPPADAVRIEEFINYFAYDYAQPIDEHPFAVHVKAAECPWQPSHRLVRIGIQGKEVPRERRSSNLVFLIDVSGSMSNANKLPLLKRGLLRMVEQLGENDRVSMVVYAGAAGLVLPPTLGDDHEAIASALNQLHAGGSTNGGQGIHLAYQTVLENHIGGGVNRVILCTDGDFNVGTTSQGSLVRVVERYSKQDVYLTVLGFGQGNLNDAMLEQISNKGNGNYAFIDSDAEAKKVLVDQLSSTLVAIAKDVKIQVEFNPSEVASYRLIGYENRKMADRDFNDDTKDAGDIGAGHTVTAMYEITPVGSEDGTSADATAFEPQVDPLKYQKERQPSKAAKSGELLTVKLRYKHPTEDKSRLIELPVADRGDRFTDTPADFQFAAAVASFGMLLRDSKFKGDASYAAVKEMASSASNHDPNGYRSQFLEIVEQAASIAGAEKVSAAPAVQ